MGRAEEQTAFDSLRALTVVLAAVLDEDGRILLSKNSCSLAVSWAAAARRPGLHDLKAHLVSLHEAKIW
jgi:hypothetical protein